VSLIIGSRAAVPVSAASCEREQSRSANRPHPLRWYHLPALAAGLSLGFVAAPNNDRRGVAQRGQRAPKLVRAGELSLQAKEPIGRLAAEPGALVARVWLKSNSGSAGV